MTQVVHDCHCISDLLRQVYLCACVSMRETTLCNRCHFVYSARREGVRGNDDGVVAATATAIAIAAANNTIYT